MRASSLAIVVTLFATAASTARAQSPSPATNARRVSGKVRQASGPFDPARQAADIVLYLPRAAVDLLFVTSAAAAGLLDNEQVVPRLEDTFYTADHTIGMFPTTFIETGFNPNIGARVIAAVPGFASTLRAGYGGENSAVAESRIRFTTATPLPGAVSLEALHDRRTDLGYGGLGAVPQSDPRNPFRSDTSLRSGVYRDVRERFIAYFGFRPAADLELLFSTSCRRRRIDDAPGAEGAELGNVFVPGAVPGSHRVNRMTYTEIALRFDTRKKRGAPETGWMVEGYSGTLRGLKDSDGDGFTLGGRAAAFIPIYRRTNILSPRIALDTVHPLDAATLPFYEYASSMDFRGIDGRLDRIAATASLDYRWVIIRYIAARTFFDTATVASSLTSLDTSHLRYAWGLGLDLHSSSTEIARIAGSLSPEGFRFFFSFGVAPSGFGDRQHR